MVATVIQLGLLDRADDRMWWIDEFLWDTKDDPPDNVKRPTEQLAFKRLFRQARLIRRKGVYINLTPLHIQALRLEHQALSQPPYPDKVYQWVSDRMAGVPPLQVKALLDECSFVILLRDVLDMKPLPIDWADAPIAVRRGRAA